MKVSRVSYPTYRDLYEVACAYILRYVMRLKINMFGIHTARALKQ